MPKGSRLDENIAGFARVLRRAGLPVGPGAVVDALAGIQSTGVGSRADFYWTLHAFFVKRRDHHAVFDAAFRRFWQMRRRPATNGAGPALEAGVEEPPAPAQRRAEEALNEADGEDRPKADHRDQHIRLLASGDQAFRNMDFAQMSAAELEAAARAIEQLRLPGDAIVTRRLKRARRGLLDPRRTLRVSLGHGGDLFVPQFRSRSTVPPPIVALCDISGSMRGYSRVLLHFLHALAARRRRVHSFVFGTRLTNITRHLAVRDPDAALAACGAAVDDWSGGTRIGDALRTFNRTWSRRVLAQGATVLLITDGLERGPANVLAAEMDRLHRSCRRLIWLNPLLRFDRFEAKAAGIRAMLPHVDGFRTVHSLSSLGDLVDALGADNADDAMATDPRRYLRVA